MTWKTLFSKKFLFALVILNISLPISLMAFVPPVTDLAVEKSDDVDPVLAGEILTYTIVVVNNGPADALSVVLSDNIPTHTTFVSAFTVSAGWALITPAVGATGTFTATNSNFASGSSATFILVVKVDSDTPDDTLLSNTATIAMANEDADLSNDSSTETTSVGLPKVSVDDTTVTEGDSGSTQACFPVTLSKPSTDVVTVDFATADGTAIAPEDYTSANGTVTFPAGATNDQICVDVNPDVDTETNETFLVNLSNPANATLGDAQATGEIEDDDIPSIGGCSLMK